MRRMIIAVIPILLTGACGMHVTEYKGDSSIQLYTQTSPMCPVLEVGEVTWMKSGRSDIGDVSAELRGKVQDMGGDALIINDKVVGLSAASVFLVGMREYRAVVVKFKKRDCRG